VLGIPGTVTSEQSRGVHRAIRQGALLVTCAAEVIEAVGGIGVDLAPEPSGPTRARDALDPLAARVLDAVPVRRAVTLESVARTAGVTPAETSAALGLLELSGFVRHGPEGWTLSRGAPR
jgi:DNA processing protein